MHVYLYDTFLDFVCQKTYTFQLVNTISLQELFHIIAPSTMYETTSFTTLDSLLNEMLTPKVYLGLEFFVVKTWEISRLVMY